MLSICGEQWEPIWTDFGGGVTRTPNWRATMNEIVEIPVLEEDGVRLTQTAPIVLPLAEQAYRFRGENEDERFRILGGEFPAHSDAPCGNSVITVFADFASRRRRSPSRGAGDCARLTKRRRQS
jgi:hypothetical protein